MHVTGLQILHEAEIATVLSVGGWILMYPVRSLFAKAKDFIDGHTKMLQDVKEELVHQRTNCLTTLQSQGTRQIEVLEKMSTTLESIHLDQARLQGRLER